MTDLISLTLAEARGGLAKKSFTSLELTDAHLAAMEAARALNAFVLETPDRARAMARAADAEIAKGERKPLAGIPLGIKDLFATEGFRTTACSRILDNFVPTYESTITSQLWRGGRCAALHGCHRNGYGRLNSPARRVHGDRRHQADLWPLLALGHRRLRIVARPGRSDRAHGARCRDPAALDGRP